MGVDPGTLITGFGIIRIHLGQPHLLLMDHLMLNKFDNHPLRLKKIFERSRELIRHYRPDEIALEAPFYGKNVQSMLKLGRAQGMVMAAALEHDIPVVEYSPKKVKMAVTGNGNASKQQVAGMVRTLMNIGHLPDRLDASDALAVALCHFFNRQGTQLNSRYTSWKNFVKNNPHRID